MSSTYTQRIFTDRINHKIQTIVECGSRDCLDAIEMLKYYKPRRIYSFECNPESIKVCLQNANGYPIEVIPMAVSNTNLDVPFFMTDMELSPDKNIGASSLLVHRDPGFIQKEITVKSTRLDSFIRTRNIDVIDLLAMDLQGAEYIALDGLGKMGYRVRYIILEIFYRSIYHNDILWRPLNKKLDEMGFSLVERDSKGGQFANALYKNKCLTS